MIVVPLRPSEFHAMKPRLSLDETPTLLPANSRFQTLFQRRDAESFATFKHNEGTFCYTVSQKVRRRTLTH